jgi:hypothetical protein
MMEAYGRPDGGHKAPKDGMIGKIRLIACEPGEFRLQLARTKVKTEEGMVVRNGPIVSYEGDADGCRNQKYDIETIVLDKPVPVKKGDQLAMQTIETSSLRCSSGGANLLLFKPPLAPGGDFEPATDTDGCWMLIEAEYED